MYVVHINEFYLYLEGSNTFKIKNKIQVGCSMVKDENI